MALAQGFGRIGCFLAGCCYGAETSGPLAVIFPDTCQYAPPGVPLVPTQLISSALDFLLFFFLILYDRKWKKRDGEVTAWYLILYSAGRFYPGVLAGRQHPRSCGRTVYVAVHRNLHVPGGRDSADIKRKSRPAAEEEMSSAEEKEEQEKDTEGAEAENPDAEQ